MVLVDMFLVLIQTAIQGIIVRLVVAIYEVEVVLKNDKAVL